MSFQPQKVDREIKDYIKDGAIHLFKNPILYILTLVICSGLTYSFSYLPRQINLFLNYMFTLFMIVWLMEITYSSTREKYNAKKYLTSFLISLVGFKSLIMDLILKTNAKYAFAIGVFYCFIPFKVEEVPFSLLSLGMMSNLDLTIQVIIFSIWSSFVITDPLMISRVTGNSNFNEMLNTAKEAAKLNKELLMKAMFTGLILVFVSLVPFSNILHFIVIISFTFYSMDVYQISKGKAQEQEQEELDNNSQAVPNMS